MTLHDDIARLLDRVDADGRPNINPLWAATKDLSAIRFNQKLIGYETARRLQAERRPAPQSQPQRAGLASKFCTQADLESPWASYWMGRLRADFAYRRKLWECCFVLQALWERGMLEDGTRGLRIGFDAEALSGIMAAHGSFVTIADTDAAAAQAMGPGARLEAALRSHAIDAAAFRRRVNVTPLGDATALHAFRAYDFCWSGDLAQRQGSVAAGLDLVCRSMATVRPEGIVVHLLEVAYAEEERAIDNWPAVLLRRRDVEQLAERLTREGHRVERLDFDIGSGFMDLFVDVPPYEHDLAGTPFDQRLGAAAHLKLMVDGFPTTSFGLVVQRGA